MRVPLLCCTGFWYRGRTLTRGLLIHARGLLAYQTTVPGTMLTAGNPLLGLKRGKSTIKKDKAKVTIEGTGAGCLIAG